MAVFEGEHIAILPESHNRGIGQYLYQYFNTEVLPALGFSRFQNYIRSNNLPSLRSAEQAGLQQKEDYAFVTTHPFLNQAHWSPLAASWKIRALIFHGVMPGFLRKAEIFTRQFSYSRGLIASVCPL